MAKSPPITPALLGAVQDARTVQGRINRTLQSPQAQQRSRNLPVVSSLPARALYATPANYTGLPVGSGYAVGDTITLTGGTFNTATRLWVRTIGLVSATIANGGSGGTDGAVVLTLTGGTQTSNLGDAVAQINGTISGGILTAVGSVFYSGDYTVSPGTSAVAVTGGNLTGCTLNLVWGVLSVDVDIEGSYNILPYSLVGTAVAQGSTSGSGTGATFFVEYTEPPVMLNSGRPLSSVSVYSGQQTFTVANGIAGAFDIHNPGNWSVTFNASSRDYYSPASGLGTVSFYHDGSEFVILGRAANAYLIMADGVLVSPRFYTVAGASGFATVNTRVVLGARRRRRIVILMRCFGLYGFAIGPNDTLERVGDTGHHATIGFMTDSYGQGTTTRFPGGSFVEAALRLGITRINLNAVGGSGFLTAGQGTAFTNTARLNSVGYGSPDIIVTAGGINDATSGLDTASASYFSSLRAANPNSVLVGVSPWGPRNSARGSGIAKRDLIMPGLTSQPGRWMWIDHLQGFSTVTTSRGFTGVVGNTTGGWQTGDGYNGATTGAGNGDVYGADGTHYNEAGNNYLGALMADAIYLGLLNV